MNKACVIWHRSLSLLSASLLPTCLLAPQSLFTLASPEHIVLCSRDSLCLHCPSLSQPYVPGELLRLSSIVTFSVMIIAPAFPKKISLPSHISIVFAHPSLTALLHHSVASLFVSHFCLLVDCKFHGDSIVPYSLYYDVWFRVLCVA